ncbi:hypothetical protein GGU10DRAFT_377646 [Lentinula aff. detonsa]|uniref:Uncharacterized protein n=1 Tax=Lentinula aff. detonsa TaxID=2804958 RepID=A0AA38KMU6_9AGAR|nr:hypothetical protein GGU10DRAFT_377646 [Lentinula aff. detonsa]
MSDSSPSPNSPGAPPPSSPISSLRALMVRRDRVRSHSIFEEDNENTDSGSANIVAINPAMPIDPILQRLQTIKRQRLLSMASIRDYEEFENANSPQEHMALVMMVVLENRDALRLLTLSQEYRVPETLKATCKDYAAVFILSPSILRYKGKMGPANVLAAMRQLNVSSLPPASETGRCDLILELIKKGMTEAQFNLKEKITASVKDVDSPSRDIATLTRACIGTSKAKATAGLFIRIAFIRWQHVQTPTHVSDKFWDKVDEALAKYRTEFRTAAEMQFAFNAIFEEDKLIYGEPDLVSHPQVAIRNVDQWLLCVNSAAGPSTGSTVAAPPAI